MIVDSSALMAIINDEPGSERLLQAAAGSTCRMSVATWLEVSIVAKTLEIEIVPVSTRHGAVARGAHRRYGRGSGSQARLNVGDCFAYALSVESGEPLLFTGDDCAQTDVAPAVRSAD